ncbi:Uu.00g105440.m01.CDS01 [Anthostomella pinea]|uniref:Uu.00g105440.m01.CDS01 n=1 Tax=Anthostomella pinea TaxID=933095 RepID=A0AAI8YFX8_9PEZI|nr:Uu.00g105440.m01.CDS01 [Anthostomella pinea]
MASAPPAGIDLEASQQTAISVVAIVCTCVATAAYGVRLWARNFQGFGMMADDWLMLVALIFTFGTLAITILGARAGAGKHVWALDPQDVANVFELLYSYTYIYAGSVSFTKLSVLLFYRRLFERGTKWFHYRLAFAAFLCVGYPITIWGVAAGMCRPASFFWTQFIGGEGKCVDVNAAFLSLTVINMVNDIIVLLVPIPEILQLQMSTQKKLAVCGVMLLGGFVCVASVVRIWAFADFASTPDVTWIAAQVFLWSSVEPAFGIVSACLPSFRPLFRRARTKMSSGGTRDGQSGNRWAGSSSKPSRVGNSYIRFGTDNESGEDEVALTSISRGPDAPKSHPHNTIMVRSEIHQFNQAR